MKALTQRQGEILQFITEYVDMHTFPPTFREIADYFAVSVKAAQDHVAALRKKGYLKHTAGRSRAMEILKIACPGDPDPEVVEIPVLGIVAAGAPVMAEEQWDGLVRLPRSLLKNQGDYFALTVRGDSMEGAGIMEGDTAIVEKQGNLRNGEIVVVQIDNRVTLKRIFWEHDRIRLQPENPKYVPIYVYSSQEAQLLGRLAAIIRSY
jgi:repressor LexA